MSINASPGEVYRKHCNATHILMRKTVSEVRFWVNIKNIKEFCFTAAILASNCRVNIGVSTY